MFSRRTFQKLKKKQKQGFWKIEEQKKLVGKEKDSY